MRVLTLNLWCGSRATVLQDEDGERGLDVLGHGEGNGLAAGITGNVDSDTCVLLDGEMNGDFALGFELEAEAGEEGTEAAAG